MSERTDPFEWDAARYGALPLPHVEWGRGVLDRLGLRGDERVLELGCGTGRDAGVLLEAHPAATLVGVDGSAAMLDAARENLAAHRGRVELRHVDLRRPFALDPVDAALSVATLHWVPDHRPAFTSVFAALRPGGRFCAECGGAGNIARYSAALRRVTGEDAAEPWHFATAEDTRDALLASGFTDVRARLRPAPVRLPAESFPAYVAAVMLGKHLEALSPADGRRLVEAVVAEVGEPVVDYVRLEFEAVKPR